MYCFSFKQFLTPFYYTICDFSKKSQLGKSQKRNALGKNRGQKWFQHRKLLWK